MRRNLQAVSAAALSLTMLISGGCKTAAVAEPMHIVKGGSTDYVVVTGTNGGYDQFAVGEFQEIMEKSTGARFVSVKAGSPEAAAAKKRIFIGDSPEVRELLGSKTVADLRNLESLVTSRGNDLVIVGGGNHGTPYGVYSFLEKEVGYRCFTPGAKGELIPPHKDLTYSRKELRERPAFDFLRGLYMLYLYEKNASMFQYRNRGDVRYPENTKMKGLMAAEHPFLDEGHGFDLYITTERRTNFYKWSEPKDYFKTNPEFFSMDKNGKRSPNIQLCFSNPELRKEFTKRIIERGERMGKSGVLTIGANDHPGSFCYCAECKKLETKYDCIGGPLYDYILECCPQVAKVLPDIKISTLAYRKAQSEFPPKNIARMPDNWICDFAPVDDDMGQALDGPRNLGTLKNLQDWHKIAKTITYWYYSCIDSAPFGIVERLQRDMKLMYENGVRGVGVCGLGSPGMFPLQEYLSLRLMIDPYQDAWMLVGEYADHMYGAASEDMRKYIGELEDVWREDKRYIGLYGPGKDILGYTPERLTRWQSMFDAMEKKLAGKERELKNLALVRWDVDMLTMDHYLRIKKAYPDWKTTPEELITRMRLAPVPQQYKIFNIKDRAETAYLMTAAADKPIPVPLDKLPSWQVRQLPLCGGNWDAKDQDAVCGRAKYQDFHKGQFDNAKTIGFDFYDEATKKTMHHGVIDISKAAPNKYALFLVGKTKIPRGGLVALDQWWISASLAPYYPEGDEHREFEIWASLKFTGPAFDKDSKDKGDRMLCDRVFIVDKAANGY